MHTALALLTGALAGLAVGLVLQRGQLCAHATVRAALDGRGGLARAWLLGVTAAAVGLAVLLLLPGTDDLNRGLAFRPVANVAGGLLMGVGMVVAQSCVSGLFYKLGSGMLGALVGLGGWAVGELAARDLDVPGPTVLAGGDAATLPGVLGLPRLLVALLLLAVVAVVLLRGRAASVPGPWPWRTLGLALGGAITLAWALAALGDSSFGPSSVGAVAGLADGRIDHWLVAFLVGIALGGLLGALSTPAGAEGAFRLRGEDLVRFLQLAAGGVLLGAGGWIAGGCTLGHGLSGAAQLNVSSLVVVASIVVGVAVSAAVARRLPAPA